MNRHPRQPLGILLTVLVMVLTLLPTAAATAASDVGTTANPVRLSASTPSGVIDPELQILATALHDATGLEFVLEFAGDEEDAVWWLCRTRQATGMRIAGPAEFVYADDCGADTRLNLIQWGLSPRLVLRGRRFPDGLYGAAGHADHGRCHKPGSDAGRRSLGCGAGGL